jgi:hypothetical protein
MTAAIFQQPRIHQPSSKSSLPQRLTVPSNTEPITRPSTATGFARLQRALLDFVDSDFASVFIHTDFPATCAEYNASEGPAAALSGYRYGLQAEEHKIPCQ